MISLKKNQVFDLGDQATKTKDRISFGLGWGKKIIQTPVHEGGVLGFGGNWSMKKSEQAVDLDASCLLYDVDGNLLEVIYFGKLKSECGSIVHSGDDQIGGGKEDAPNEFIFITLSDLPEGVHTVVFTVSCYSGDTFQGIPHAYCNVFDRDTNTELARFNLQIRARDSKGFIIAKVTRANEHWDFVTIGLPLGGRQRTIEDLVPFAEACV
jgi:tellurium resistance protein TerZ